MAGAVEEADRRKVPAPIRHSALHRRFFCPSLGLIIEVDGETHVGERDISRDGDLAELGYLVLRFTNADVMTSIDGVYASITSMIEALRPPHPNPFPGGEGLDTVEAQNLLGIGLEGNVG